MRLPGLGLGSGLEDSQVLNATIGSESIANSVEGDEYNDQALSLVEAGESVSTTVTTSNKAQEVDWTNYASTQMVPKKNIHALAQGKSGCA